MDILPLLLFTAIGGTAALDIRECGRKLGMENGVITDSQISASSSFDELSTGPQNARIRTHLGGGAWCPKTQINSTSSEWLQIAFSQDMLITAVETQGRDDGGLGAEFAEELRIEYWRPSLAAWARYRDGAGAEIVPGNVDPRSTALHPLDGAVIARRIRFVPVSRRMRTVCMRVEVYGCTYKGSLVSYSMPDGSEADSLSMRDWRYDGQLADGRLAGGVGKLFDGRSGEDDFERNPQHWVGWRTAPGQQIVLNFTFAEQRNFSAISIHTNNQFKMDALAFVEAEVLFSQNRQHFSSRLVHFSYRPDLKFDSSRWIRIPVPDRIANEIQLRLKPAPSAAWLLLSEVRFESGEVAFEWEDAVHEKHIELHHNGVTLYAVDDDATHGSYGIFATVVLVAVCLSAIGGCLWRACSLRRPHIKPSPSPAFNAVQPQIHLMIDGSTIKRVSPSTYQMAVDNAHNAFLEKLPLDSEYADPDMSLSTECGSTAPLLGAYQSTSRSTYPTLPSITSPARTLSSPLSCVTQYADYGEVYCAAIPEIECSKLQFVRRISEGTIGEVQLCRLEQRLVAVRALSAQVPVKEARRELDVLGSLKHPNVVETIGVCPSEPLCCVMEHMDRGDLETYLRTRERLDTRTALAAATGLAAGLAYLESRGVLLGHLAAHTCLVDAEGNAKIAHFERTQRVFAEKCCTDDEALRWTSCETALQGEKSTAADVWAFGVTLWEVLGGCRERPFRALDAEQRLENLRQCARSGRLESPLPAAALCPPGLHDSLLRQCWARCPSDRPTFRFAHLQLQTLLRAHI